MADERYLTAQKYPSEIIDQGVDYATILGVSDTISSGTVVVKDAQGNDVTSTMVDGSASVNGSQVIYRLKAAGSEGDIYRIYVSANLATGEKIGQTLVLTILYP